MKTLMDWLNPAAVVDQFNTVRKPEPSAIPDLPARPDYADTITHSNGDIEESSIWSPPQ